MTNETQQRRNKILNLVNSEKEVSNDELVKEFDTTEITIKRDLVFLEQQDQLYRTQNGAVKKEQLAGNKLLDLDTRGKLNQEEKSKIGRLAASYICNGDSLFIDGGSTTQILASLLSNKSDLLVVTNTITIGNLLSCDKSKRNKVYLIGGELSLSSNASFGSSAEEVISSLRVNKAFIGTSGIDVSRGFTAAYNYEARIKNLMINQANEAFIIADSTKFTDGYPYLFSPLLKKITLITDDKISQKDLSALQATAIHLRITD
jgi:DeoR/GlpR family transcriptional regulator of sugar metabolism